MANSVIGIDLGTTYSCVGVWKNNHVEIIANNLGNRTTPSCVSFCDERLIGEPAIYKRSANPENTVFGVKRLMGRFFSDEKIQSDMRFWPFKVIEKFGKPYIQVEFKNEIKEFAPEEISSMILSKMKEIAEDYLGHPVSNAVITVPAYFNDSQRKATKDAGTIAGLNVLRIINEPTAAAFAYGLENKISNQDNILVVDLGGGTYDVSLLNINNGVFEVKAISGNTHLGGEDFTNRLIDYSIKVFKKKYGKDISTNLKSLSLLKKACERAKHILSSSSCASIEIESLYEGIDFSCDITRSRFEDLNSDLFDRIIEPIEEVLKDSNLNVSDVREIVLVGGSTRIPKIQDIISNYFNGKKLIKSINPDEAVAYGAAIQASVLSEEIIEELNDLVLLDVTPLSLGIEIKGGIMSTIIERNSTIPVKRMEEYLTSYDNQTSASIKIIEGERSLTKDNTLLDEFVLDGITPAPRGEVEIDVTFEIDRNGILNVLAIEKATGLSKKISVINNKDKFHEKEIERMIKDAEKFKEMDKKEKERIESRNSLEGYALDLRKSLKNKQDLSKLSLSNINELNKAINSTIEWIETNKNSSKEEIESYKLKLKNIATPIMFNLL